MTNKKKRSYKTIGEVVKILNANKNSITGSKPHTLRFWEKHFKQIKPIKINNHRYYDEKSIDILIKVQYLLKSQGMTINGVKKVLNSNNLNVDENDKKNISTLNIKFRLNKINNIIKNLKKNNG
tara:strand:+ start:2833 stop:3204 length:372 start_codon:yes stop_codon:yes gene_type:complete